MTVNNYRITAEVRQYQWYDLDKQGVTTEPTDQVEFDKFVQYQAYNRETGDEFFTDELQKAIDYATNKSN